ncbi:hypothetical protein C8F01DRAFT_1264834 [Mycena amicta]|nr:hypothetical protein C8F01DRAFT_1264834 [Mycena amicta]
MAWPINKGKQAHVKPSITRPRIEQAHSKAAASWQARAKPSGPSQDAPPPAACKTLERANQASRLPCTASPGLPLASQSLTWRPELSLRAPSTHLASNARKSDSLDRLFMHATMRLNFTTYDLQRDHDCISPRVRPDIMILSHDPNDKHP